MLNDPTLRKEAAFVGGEWIAADENGFAVTNPTDGSIIGHNLRHECQGFLANAAFEPQLLYIDTNLVA